MTDVLSFYILLIIYCQRPCERNNNNNNNKKLNISKITHEFGGEEGVKTTRYV